MTTAFIFPGQGSQAVGMGRDLYDHPQGRAVFDEASAVLGFDLARLCLEGPEDQLIATENAQPAILTVSIAALRVLEAMLDADLPAPALAAGHSLGEWSALVAAGALDLATALRLVRRRGELMAQANEGAMAAIMGLELEPLAAICQAASALGPCVVANQNAPGQLVISGTTAAVSAAMEQAKEAGARRVQALNVSAAFHSPLMAAAEAGLRAALAEAPISAARIPIIANTSAAPIQDAEAIRQELAAQVTAPVRWIDTVRAFEQHGIDTVIELGAGSVLTGLIKRIAPQLRRLNMARPDDSAGLREILAGA